MISVIEIYYYWMLHYGHVHMSSREAFDIRDKHHPHVFLFRPLLFTIPVDKGTLHPINQPTCQARLRFVVPSLSFTDYDLDQAVILWVVATSNICGMFIPKTWGFMMQFDLRNIFFLKWVGEKPPTTSSSDSLIFGIVDFFGWNLLKIWERMPPCPGTWRWLGRWGCSFSDRCDVMFVPLECR